MFWGFKWFYPLLPCTPFSKASEESTRIHKLLDSRKFRGKIIPSFCVFAGIVFPRAVLAIYSSGLLMIAYILLSDPLMVPPDFMMARICCTPLSEAYIDAFINFWHEAQSNIIIWQQSIRSIISQSLKLQSLTGSKLPFKPGRI